jgi:hypothetical protein
MSSLAHISAPWLPELWTGPPLGASTIAPTPTVMGIVANGATVGNFAAAMPILHAGPGAAPWEMSPIKGALTEELMGHFITKGFLRGTASWTQCTAGRIGPNGIDGLFVRLDAHGMPRSLLVAEAKFGTSQLGMTTTGKQISATWTAERLGWSAQRYARLAVDLRGEQVLITTRPPPAGADVTQIPLRRGDVALVWRKDGRVCIQTNSSDLRTSEVEVQARRLAEYFEGAARGRVSYRSRLFKFKVEDGQFKFVNVHIDPVTGQSTGQVEMIKAAFEKLPRSVQETLRGDLERQFVEMGKSQREARELAKKVCEDPSFFEKMRREPSWSWRAGLDLRLVATGVAGGFMGFITDALSQFLGTGGVNWRRAAWTGGLSAVSAMAGQYVGVQVGSLLATTEIGRNLIAALPLGSVGGFSPTAIVSGAAGGIAAGLVLSYGMWLAGLSDLRTANVQAAAGAAGALAGAGATAGTLGLVMTFGSASTGTAISTLSGAAATNSALAWLGGGSVAAGGGGMAMGAMVLTGGAVAVALAVSVGVNLAFSKLEEREQQMLLEGKLKLVTERVQNGVQAEWGGHAACHGF